MSGTIHTTYNRRTVPNGSDVFFIEAGPADGPVLLLLHGYPSSSNQYRRLLQSPLAATHRLIAPDLPGFGLTETRPSVKVTFQYMAEVLSEFLNELKVDSYIVYIFDFGAPAFLRLATMNDREGAKVRGIITQNGNMHHEGLGKAWAPLQEWWKTDTAPGVESTAAWADTFDTIAANAHTLDAVKSQYYDGVPVGRVPHVDPYAYHSDYDLNMRSPDKKKTMTSLFWDYRTNVTLYYKWQAWVKSSNLPILAVWGANEEWFIPQGAEAWGKTTARARVDLLDTGHFAIESHAKEIINIIAEWLETESLT